MRSIRATFMARISRRLCAARLRFACLLALAAPIAFAQPVVHIQTIDSWQFSPASPDPAGLIYLPDTDTLLAADSEVNEIPALFSGSNMFEFTLDGSLLQSFGATAFTFEPTGLGYDAAGLRLFVTDDNRQRVWIIEPGTNGLFDGVPPDDGDDVVAGVFRTYRYGSNDPEGVTWSDDEEVLYVVDGNLDRVYRISAGANSVFDEVPPYGDDEVSSFSTIAFGLDDPEGIAFDPDSGFLYIVGKPKDTLFQVTPSGFLVGELAIPESVDPGYPAGLAVAPASLGGNDPYPNVDNVYVVDRGDDNNYDPNENDGRVFELSIPPLGGGPVNLPPTVAAGADQVVPVGATLSLDATVSDDGEPDPPGSVTTTWSTRSGPAAAQFGDAGAVDTSVVFPTAGVYVLQLGAYDGGLRETDDLTVNVLLDTPAVSEVYLSTGGTAVLGGILVRDEDIVHLDLGTGAWSVHFDGSDVGMSASGVDTDAVHLMPDGSILLSVTAPATLPGLGLVDDSDVVRFVPTQTGTTTSGSFEWYIDGSDIGLEASGEDVSLVAFAPDGRILLSTTGYANLNGLIVQDEDLIAFDPVSLGANTSGTVSRYFDGSDVGLADGSGDEELYGAWVGSDGDLYLSTRGPYSVPGAAGTQIDFFVCMPQSLGSATSCVFQTVFNGSVFGLDGEQIDGLYLVP